MTIQDATIDEIKKEVQARLIETPKELLKKDDVYDVLKYIAPGTSLRSGIEGVLKAKTGALIVIENDVVPKIIEGGFKVNCRFTPQRLIELSKMDGAMVLSKDMKKIVYANALLTPDNSISSNETGTRHKAGERSAKQAKTMVIAISQRRDEITLFYKNIRYVVHNYNDVIRRATEVLQILEKHKEVFEKIQEGLNREETNGTSNISRAVSLIQKSKMILKISETLKKHIIELGAEGTIVKARLKEILHNVERECNNVVRDYSRIGLYRSNRQLDLLSYDELVEPDSIKSCLGFSEDVGNTFPRGYRVLSKIGLSDKSSGMLIKEFKNLPTILSANPEEINRVLVEKGIEVSERFRKLKNGGA